MKIIIIFLSVLLLLIFVPILVIGICVTFISFVEGDITSALPSVFMILVLMAICYSIISLIRVKIDEWKKKPMKPDISSQTNNLPVSHSEGESIFKRLMKSEEFRFPYFTVVLLLTAFTHQIHVLHEIIYWRFYISGVQQEELVQLKDLTSSDHFTDTSRKFKEQILRAEDINHAAFKLLYKLDDYKNVGLIALIVSIVCLFRSRPFTRIVTLPIGLYAGYLVIFT